MGRVLAGIAALIVVSSAAASRAEEAGARLAGRWTVKFDNGVEEWCEIGKDLTASVLETRRKSAGKMEVRDGSVLIVYDDDRTERWTPVGRRAVVEHWFPSAAYPRKAPVVGIAEVRRGVDPEEVQRADPDGRELKGLVTAKTFAASLRQQFSDETAGELRKFIDPRYLKEHRLAEGPFPIRRVVTGSIYTNSPVDLQTIFLIVETKEAEKEVWLLRMTEYKGEMYIQPPTPPDPQTKSFKPWTFRKKL
jgi:hypothetical protein